MQRLKRCTVIILLFVIMLSLVSCNEIQNNDVNGITVVATLFPQYDFARAILGEKGNAVLLLTPGADSHNFELTPSDMKTINDSDIFIYTGPDMEIWADGIVNSIRKNVTIVSLSNEIGVLTDSHEDHEDHVEHNDHFHSSDPHIWTNPKYAVKMLEVIYEKICLVDPDNKDYYNSNYQVYLKDLKSIDEEFTLISKEAKDSCLYFSGKFAFKHFVDEYGFRYKAPFNSCSDVQIESLASVKQLISDIKANDVKFVFYEELSNSTILDTIVSETGVTPLLLHSTHNISKTDYLNGETYISLMKGNVRNLRKALIDG